MFKSLRHLYRFISSKFSTIHLDYQVDPKARYPIGKPHGELYKKINTGRTSYAILLRKLLSFQESIKDISTCKEGIPETAPCWNNGYLPGLDIFTLYSLLSLYQPKRYIEIGSGNSTKVASKAISDQNLPTQITCIDPQPRASIKGLANQWHQDRLEDIPDLSIFKKMEAGDILFIDNSHYAFPNSDVICVFLDILPQLKKGVLVQIHDIYLPYDYPDFMLHRFYNEQYILATLLLYSTQFEILLPNYFISEDVELSQILLSFWDYPNLEGVERHGGSFWMVRQ